MDALDRRVNAVRLDLADSRLEGRVAAARFVAGEPSTVIAASAPVRRRPEGDAPLDTEALFGEPVLVFDHADGWSFVQLAGDGYVGYLPSEALEPGAAPTPTHCVSTVRTLVFPEPDIKRPPIGALPFGAAVVAVGGAEDRNARYVELDGGGFVVVQHLRPVDAPAADAVEEALRFVGSPYLWGGKTSLGVDCSGLIQMAFGASGVALPRDSDMQEASDRFETIPLDSPRRRGDLVFWPGHVGILLDTERLLHANAHAMLTAVEPLTDAVDRIAARGGALRAVRRLKI